MSFIGIELLLELHLHRKSEKSATKTMFSKRGVHQKFKINFWWNWATLFGKQSFIISKRNGINRGSLNWKNLVRVELFFSLDFLRFETTLHFDHSCFAVIIQENAVISEAKSILLRPGVAAAIIQNCPPQRPLRRFRLSGRWIGQIFEKGGKKGKEKIGLE